MLCFFLPFLALSCLARAQVPGYFAIEPSTYQSLTQSQLSCLLEIQLQMPNNSGAADPIIFATRVSKADGTVDLAGIRTLQAAITGKIIFKKICFLLFSFGKFERWKFKRVLSNNHAES